MLSIEKTERIFAVPSRLNIDADVGVSGSGSDPRRANYGPYA